MDLQTGERYFIPVVGGLTEEAVDDSEIPGGAPIIIEDFFHKHYKKSTEKGHSVDGKEKEESGFWYAILQEFDRMKNGRNITRISTTVSYSTLRILHERMT